jgi:hypothetical protein
MFPSRDKDKAPAEPAGLWPKRYKAMTMAELVSELARLASEAPQHDYDKRRHFILQELDQRTARPD